MLNHKIFGQGNPLIILHGLFGSLDNWQSIGKRWAESHQVILVDLPNHGKSPHTESFSYEQMANEVAGLIQSLNLKKVSILGHSMGGKTAMVFSILFPHLLEKLIILDIAPKAYPPHHQQIIEGLFSFNPGELKSRKEADEIMSKIIPDIGVRLFLLKNLSRNKGEGFKWKMNLNMLSNAVNQVIESTEFPFPINLPCLFIRGGKSNYILDEDIDDIKSKFPLSDIKTIDNAGHWVHAEQPEILYNIVLQFLQ